jgi:putative DNA primase/helicase
VSLKAVVAALGGELYQGGLRASVPAPGHSRHDRSISLWLVGARVVIHSFGGADWREARLDLRERRLIDAQSCLTGAVGQGRVLPSANPSWRREVARLLWEDGLIVGGATPAGRYLARRAVPLAALNLRYHPRVPVSVYRPGRVGRPALIARISDDADRLKAVEVSYLESNGLPASSLRLPRKTIGQVPAGAAVRLAPAARRMVVGEGVCTTLSAMERFRRPGWALRSAHNLAAWCPPAGVEDVLIAADRGGVGEAAAAGLRMRLLSAGLQATIVLPPEPHGDWNARAMAEARTRRKEEGRGGAPAGRGRSPATGWRISDD